MKASYAVKNKIEVMSIYALRLFIFLLFVALCSAPFYVLWNYYEHIDNSKADISIPADLARGLTVGIGSLYMLAGCWVGWKLRTHSIYNDIYDVDDPVKYAEAKAALNAHGRNNGWEE